MTGTGTANTADMPAGEAGTELTAAERALVDATLAGQEADCKRRHVRAGVLRDLLLEARPGWTLPPAGLRIHRAIVEGTLDLEGVTLAKPFIVRHSRFEGKDGLALVLRDARVRRIGLHSCTLDGGVNADRVEVESGLFLGGGSLKGSIQIRGASITGAFSLEGNEVGDGTNALLAAGITVTGPMILRRMKAAGAVLAPRARIGAGVYCEDASVAVAAGPAFDLESASVGGDVLLERASFTGPVRLDAARIDGRLAGNGVAIAGQPHALMASGAGIGRGLSLREARLGGTLVLEGADVGKALDGEAIEIDGATSAILADVVRIGGNCNLARARLVGELSMPGAEIAGQLRLTEAKLYGAEGAIRADGSRIRGGVFMSRALVFGTMRFPACEIGNQFRLRGANLKTDHGAVLLASGTRFNRDVELGHGMQTVGAIVLDQAEIRGALDLAGGRLVSAAVARAGVVPAKAAADPLSQSHDERALSLVDARAGRVQMPVTEADRPRGIVDLSRACVGSYADAAAAWPLPPAKRVRAADGRDIEHLVLDGFVCEHLANPHGGVQGEGRTAARQRLAWLAGQADGKNVFKPQAWVALEKRLDAQGLHDDARAIAIERRRQERRSAGARFGERWQGLFLDWFALYGHNPWRTVLWMIVFVLAFAGLWSWAASHCKEQSCLDDHVLVATKRDAYKAETLATAYPPFNPLGFSFDAFVPFVSSGHAEHWRPNARWMPLAEVPLPDIGPWRGRPGKDGAAPLPVLTITGGGLLQIAYIVEKLLGLVLASLAVTGFTGLLKRGG